MKQQLSSIQDLEKLDTTTHDISMYPAAKAGQERLLIHLPKLENEENYEVELTVGKWEEVDCNNHSLMGKIQEKNLDGWGYTIYDFETNGQVASTLMACPDRKLENKLIKAKSIKVRYNSKLPIVIYTPEGYEVNYSLWTNIGTKVAK